MINIDETKLRTIFRAITLADGGCDYCVKDIFKEILKDIPETKSLINEVLKEKDMNEF